MQDTTSALEEWKQGWTLGLSAAVGMSLSSLYIFTLGVFAEPLEREFGWSRTTVTSGMMIIAGVSFFLSPAVGYLVDRFGPRRIGVPGVLVYCSCFALLSTAQGSRTYWWALWVLIALAALMVKPTIWTAAVASRFDKARGLAFALTLSGAGMTGILAPAVAGYFTENHGWRAGFAGVALIWFAVAMPMVLLFFHSASDLDRTRAPGKPRTRPSGTSIRDAVKSGTFIKLALIGWAGAFTVTSGLVHFVPIVVDGGLDRSSAIVLASVVGGSAFVGRLVSGSLLDRFDARKVGGLAFAMPGVACIGFLLYDGDLIPAIALAVLFGASSGAEFEVISYLSSRFFGLRNYAFLFSIVVALTSLGSGTGPPLASMTYDHFRTYDVALYCGIVLSFAASVTLLTLARYPRRFEDTEAQADTKTDEARPASA